MAGDISQGAAVGLRRASTRAAVSPQTEQWLVPRQLLALSLPLPPSLARAGPFGCLPGFDPGQRTQTGILGTPQGSAGRTWLDNG